MPLPGAGKKPYRMLSIPDMALLGAAALMIFGPDQLPKVARKVGVFMRDVQNTSHEFVREMERAADEAMAAERLATSPDYFGAPTNGAAHAPELPDLPAEPALYDSPGESAATTAIAAEPSAPKPEPSRRAADYELPP